MGKECRFMVRPSFASAFSRQAVVLPVAVEIGRTAAMRGAWAAGPVVRTGRWAWHSIMGMRRAASAADSGGPEGPMVMRPGIPRGNVAPPVNASDGINGYSSRGIGVNGASAWCVAPDGKACGIIQKGGLSPGREADFSVDVDFRLRHGGGKGQEGKQGAPGAVGKNMVFNGVVFHGFWNNVQRGYPLERTPGPVLCKFPRPLSPGEGRGIPS